jgi:hypothetical protein
VVVGVGEGAGGWVWVWVWVGAWGGWSTRDGSTCPSAATAISGVAPWIHFECRVRRSSSDSSRRASQGKTAVGNGSSLQ